MTCYPSAIVDDACGQVVFDPLGSIALLKTSSESGALFKRVVPVPSTGRFFPQAAGLAQEFDF
jgi:hypothetical protein